MKKFYTLLFAFIISQMGYSQAVGWNVTLQAQVTFGSGLNDVWGWVDGSENEYALVGLRDSVVIVDVSTPTAPVKIHTISGPTTTWRDLKTWGDHAYVVHDGVGGGSAVGLLIIDLSGLPGSITYKDTIMDGMENSHNVWIDEAGYMYLIGGPGGVNDGFMIYDLNPNPEVPVYKGEYTEAYCHDIYVRGDYAYTAEIYSGVLGIVDVSDKTAPVKIGATTYPGAFTHNTWLNDASDVCFTTDEVSGAWIHAFDVSDPADIKMLDRIQSSLSGGTAMVHNTHVLNDWLITSYYKDGINIVDAARPHNLIEMGWYDTNPASGSGGGGCWGAYPFLPSGICLATDMSTGLWILGPDYIRGCYLEGTVTDSITGSPIVGADILISGPGISDVSDLTGTYATGLSDAGTYTVTYSKFGYLSKSFSLVLDNGVLVLQDVELVPAGTVNTTINVIDNATLFGIPNAKVDLIEILGTLSMTADGGGTVTDPAIPEGTYTLNVGAWGYLGKQVTLTLSSPTGAITVGLDRGYYDDFSLDLGWNSFGTASTGDWERGDPVGDFSGGQMMNPEDDVVMDYGLDCYVTGIGTGAVGAADIDGGVVSLRTPPMDLTTYGDPTIRFYRYFANGGGSSALDDTLSIILDNGTVSMTLAKITGNQNSWVQDSFRVADFMTPTSTMYLEFMAGDYGDGHLVESAVDLFEVVDTVPLTGIQEATSLAEMKVFPNPFQKEIGVEFSLKNASSGTLQLVNLVGTVVSEKSFTGSTGVNRMELAPPATLSSGIYFVRVETAEGSFVEKVMKR